MVGVGLSFPSRLTYYLPLRSYLGFRYYRDAMSMAHLWVKDRFILVFGLFLVKPLSL